MLFLLNKIELIQPRRVFSPLLIAFFMLGLVFCPVLVVANTSVNPIRGSISTVGDAVHIEFKGQDKWNYELKHMGNQVTLSVPKFDEKTLLDLKSWQHSYFKSIKVEDGELSNTYKVTFNLNQKYIESFDYLTDQPSRLIVDFYVDKEKKKSTAVSNKKIKTNKVAKKINKPVSNKSTYRKMNKSSRSPASELLQVDAQGDRASGEVKHLASRSGVFDAGDPKFDRFRIKNYKISEKAIIASQQNIYIRFPMLKMTSSQLDSIKSHPPEYVINPKKTKENEEARFLQVLFNKNKNASFLKTYDFFMNKYPDSEYKQILGHMFADTHYRMWEKNKEDFHYKKAEKKYLELIREYPKSPLAERTKLLLAYTELEQGISLSSIQSLNQFLKRFPDSKDVDRARFAIAEGFFLINKYDTAYSIYDELLKQHKDPISAVEAQYRKGDVFFKKRNYKKAINYYKNSISKYKEYEGTYPNANFNMAESYFWRGDYRNALEHYIRFSELFPTHKHNAYSLTRIGETLEILGADKTQYMGAYIESYFRFQKSAGAQVARVRMLSKQMKGMKEKELNRTLKEMNDIVKNYDLPKIDEFVTLMITDGFRTRREYDKALSELITYYQKNPTSANLSFFKRRIVGNIADSINDKILEKDFISSLQIFDKYSTTWLRNSDRYDMDYFLGRSYELAGVYKEANKIYKNLYNKIIKIEGTREGLERTVNEHLPSKESMNLRLAATALNRREYVDSYGYLKKIKEPKKLSQKEQVERVSIAAKVHEERGEIKKAISNLKQLISEWEGKEDILTPVHIKLSELYMKNKDYIKSEVQSQEALSLLETAENNKENSELIAEALKLKADAVFNQNRKVESVEIYLSLLSRFEKEKGLEYVRYKAGQIVFDTGDLKGAEKIWLDLENSNNQFYWQLAQEKLSNANWQDSYSKYIDRIPAMKR